MKNIGKLLAASAIAVPMLALAVARSGAVDQGRVGVALDPDVAGPARGTHGEWRTKVQQIFDPATRTLSRRTYTVWDPDPARNLDFAWTPDNPTTDRPGRIGGAGRVVWRLRDKPSYDPTAVVAEYRGTFRNGQLDGRGSYVDQAGVTYDGNWRAGVPNGHGRLTLPGGDEYAGSFRDGKAHGSGRYINATGEIYEGPFVAGQRHGGGIITLPNGRTYHSLWTAGRESDRSRLVRIAQGPGVPVPGSAEDIRISIGIDRRVPDRDLHSDALWYTATNDASTVQIRPASDRLMKMWQDQGPLQLAFDENPVLSLKQSQLVPLKLRVEVQNKTPDPLQVAGISIDVKESTTDLKPAVQIRLESTEQHGSGGYSYSPVLLIENFGWAAAEGANVRFAVSASQASGGQASFEVAKPLGNLQRSIRVDLEPDLRAAGVDTKYLGGLEDYPCKSKVPRQCQQEARASSKFGSLRQYVELQERTLVLKLASVLEYSWHDAKGNKREWKHPFLTTLPLAYLPQEAEGAEGAGAQTVTTKAQRFHLDSSGYSISVPFQTAIPSGQSNQLLLPVEAEKSSEHEFTVVVQTVDRRTIRSRPVKLTYYRPSWFAEEPVPPPDEDPDAPLQNVSNYDVIGTDIRRFNVAGQEDSPCSGSCAATQACRAYSFDRWKHVCALKSAVTALRLDPASSSGLKKGVTRPPASQAAKVLEPYKNTAFKNTDAGGGEKAYLVDLQSSLAECEQRCQDDNKCLAFTFKKRETDCLLFDAPAGYTSDNTADSGVKRQLAN